MIRKAGLCALALALGAPALSSAATFTFSAPSEDRWMYPFNGTPGIRPTAPTFSGVGSYPSFDNRDGQFLIQFDTGSLVSSGLGAGSYAITGARLEITTGGGAFAYDPTYDAFGTHLSDPDTDLGRPIEVFGVGYRNGFDTASFLENSPFSPGGLAAGTRNAYASDFFGGADRDVSNNVQSGFDPNPFGIGLVALAPGSTVAVGTTFSVDLGLTPDVLGYLQQRLDAGAVDLMVTSLTEAALGGPPTYPSWATRENGTYAAPKLILDVAIVPEPAALGLFFGVLMMAGVGRIPRR